MEVEEVVVPDNSTPSVEEAKELLVLTQKLQRDVNCLADPNRSTRRRALDKLKQAVFSTSEIGRERLWEAFFYDSLASPLLRTISDPIEKCRELAIEICKQFANCILQDSTRLFHALVPILQTRIGSLPFIETAEEIRLQLLELSLAAFTKANFAKEHDLLVADYVIALSKAVTDSFPESKKCACKVYELVAGKAPWSLHLHLQPAVKSVCSCLSHQHSKVRQGAIQEAKRSLKYCSLVRSLAPPTASVCALQYMIPSGADSLKDVMLETLVPILSKLPADRTASVRREVISMVAYWMKTLPQSHGFDSYLLPTFLLGLCDETTEVQNHTMQELEHLDSFWISLIPEGEPAMPDTYREPPTTLTNPYRGRPGAGTRWRVQSTIEQTLRPALRDISDWTAQTRSKSASILLLLVIATESRITAHLEEIVTALAKSCRDEHEAVADSIFQAAVALGHYAEAEVLLSLLLPKIRGQNGFDTPTHKANYLSLLGAATRGMSKPTLQALLELVTQTLKDVCCSDAAEVQEQLLVVCQDILDAAEEVCGHDIILLYLHRVLLQVAATASNADLEAEAARTITLLATASGLNTYELYAKNAEGLLAMIEPPMDYDGPSWLKGDPLGSLFDTLCRHGGQALKPHSQRIITTILVHANIVRDADVRLLYLALLETLLEDQNVNMSLAPFSSQIIVKGIVPNLVWKAGRVAATIRKVAIACLYVLYREGLANRSQVFETTPQVLPLLKSNLDDGDEKTRQLVCLSLKFLFTALPQSLGDDPVQQLYPELLKRLDDSSDLVRKQICQTISAFLNAAPSDLFKGTRIEYMVDVLLIHLDDPDRSVQDEVFLTLKEAVKVDAQTVEKKCIAARPRQRTHEYCDQLLQYVASS